MDKADWQGPAGDVWASHWRQTDRSFFGVTEELLRRTRGLKFRQALDVGCGAGELSLAIARGRPATHVCGLDISPSLIDAAKERGSNFANLDFVLGDASQWQPSDDFAPDLIVSRHGVMFFNDSIGAFRHLAQLGGKSAGLLFSCFQGPEHNPLFSEAARLLPDGGEIPEPGAPGPMAFANKDRIREILQRSGWRDIVIDPLSFHMTIGAGEDPVRDASRYLYAIGPASRVAREIDEDAKERLYDRLCKLASRYCHEGVVAFPAAAWIVKAAKA